MLKEIGVSGGVLLDYTNDALVALDVSYASFSAPIPTRCEIYVGGVLWDAGYWGGGDSHSWWAGAGGKLLPPQGLKPNQRLVIKTGGQASMRLDWTE